VLDESEFEFGVAEFISLLGS